MFAVFVVFEYSDIRPAALKIITPTSASHKMASSVAFLDQTGFTLVEGDPSVALIRYLLDLYLPPSHARAAGGEGALVADQTTSSSRSFLVLEWVQSQKLWKHRWL